MRNFLVEFYLCLFYFCYYWWKYETIGTIIQPPYSKFRYFSFTMAWICKYKDQWGADLWETVLILSMVLLAVVLFLTQDHLWKAVDKLKFSTGAFRIHGEKSRCQPDLHCVGCQASCSWVCPRYCCSSSRMRTLTRTNCCSGRCMSSSAWGACVCDAFGLGCVCV